MRSSLLVLLAASAVACSGADTSTFGDSSTSTAGEGTGSTSSGDASTSPGGGGSGSTSSGDGGGTAGSGGAGPCEDGAKRCADLDVETCSGGVWAVTDTCLFVCGDGVCQGTCEPGAKQCSAGDEQTCNELGQWTTTEVCELACDDGECVGECLENQRRCLDEGTVQYCCVPGVGDACEGFSDYSWGPTESCEFYCNDGGPPYGAYCDGCALDEARCISEDGGATWSEQTCDAVNHWQDPVACPEGCHQLQGRCNTCGDGVRFSEDGVGEECDGADLSNENGGLPLTCEDVGFSRGVLACDDACVLDTSGCE